MAGVMAWAAFCRDCLSDTAVDAPCSACGSTRVLAHPELHALSIAHLDCDAFYAAIEKRDDPSLNDKPLIVGGVRKWPRLLQQAERRQFVVGEAIGVRKARITIDRQNRRRTVHADATRILRGLIVMMNRNAAVWRGRRGAW